MTLITLGAVSWAQCTPPPVPPLAPTITPTPPDLVKEEVWSAKSAENLQLGSFLSAGIEDYATSTKWSGLSGSKNTVATAQTGHWNSRSSSRLAKKLLDEDPTHRLVIYDPDKPAEALQTQYIEWAMEALPCDWDCAGAAGVWRFIRDGAHVSFCESGQQPEKEGLLGERGVFQLHPIHAGRFKAHGWAYQDAYDPVKNIVVAHELYLDQGWRPWFICRRSIP